MEYQSTVIPNDRFPEIAFDGFSDHTCTCCAASTHSRPLR